MFYGVIEHLFWLMGEVFWLAQIEKAGSGKRAVRHKVEYNYDKTTLPEVTDLAERHEANTSGVCSYQTSSSR